jgi:hypothetical protein
MDQVCAFVPFDHFPSPKAFQPTKKPRSGQAKGGFRLTF